MMTREERMEAPEAIMVSELFITNVGHKYNVGKDDKDDLIDEFKLDSDDDQRGKNSSSRDNNGE